MVITRLGPFSIASLNSHVLSFDLALRVFSVFAGIGYTKGTILRISCELRLTFLKLIFLMLIFERSI